MTLRFEPDGKRIVFVGPPGSGKTRSLIEIFNHGREAGIESRALYIVPDASAREHVRDILVRFAPASVPRAFTDRGVQSLGSFARELGGSPSAGISHLRALIPTWVTNGRLSSGNSGLLTTSGGRSMLASAVLALRSYGHTSGTVSSAFGHPRERPRALIETLALWEAWLDGRGAVDDQGALIRAREEARKREWEVVLIDGFTEVLPLQWLVLKEIIDRSGFAAAALDPEQPPSAALLERFLEAGFREATPDCESRWGKNRVPLSIAEISCNDTEACAQMDSGQRDGSISLRIICARDARIEAAQLAREVAGCVRRGYRFSDIAIIAPALSRFRPYLETEFRRADIPIRFFIDLPLTETAPGALLESLLSVVSGDWADETVLRLLSNAVLGIRRDSVRDAYSQTKAHRRLGSREAWTDWAKGDIGDLLRGISSLGERELVDPMEFGQRLIGIAGAGIRKSWEEAPDEAVAEEGWAWGQVRSLILSSCRALSETVGPANPQAIAKSMLLELKEARGKPLDRRRDCVNALTLLQARTWAVPVAIVAGLAREYFPRRMSANPFLPDSLRAGLDPPLPTYDELQAREEALFRVAVTRAGDRLVLSWPENDPDGTPLLPSRPLERCMKWLGDAGRPEKAQHDPPVSPADAVFPSDIAAVALESGVTDRALLDEVSSRSGRPLNEPVQQSETEVATISRPDTLVESALGSPERPISPTDLNNLALCPYLFFARRLLRLREPDREIVEAGFSPLQWGNIAHEVLARWFRDGKHADFEGLVRQAVEKRSEITPSSDSEAQVYLLVEALRRFADFEKENLLTVGYIQKHAELVFGRSRTEGKKHAERVPVQVEIAEGMILTLGGRIDRVDLRDRTHALVMDYKRSWSSQEDKALKDGRDFQLSSYVELVERGLGLQVDLACFLPLRRKSSEKIKALVTEGLESSLDKSPGIESREKITLGSHMEASRAAIAELVRKLDGGDVSPKPAYAVVCSRCAFRDLCRYRDSGSGEVDEDAGGGD